jgi:NitT/TauT family transport system substrate-binding protein
MRHPVLSRRQAAGALLALPALASPAIAQTAPPVRLVLDWAPQPHQSPWFLAADRGHFAREGLTVTIDRGFGSGDAMNKVASGTHDIGLGDGNLLLQWNAQNPAQRMLMVFLLMDRGQHSIVSLRGRGIAQPRDLAGKRIARTTGDIIGPLWPAFSRMHGIDNSRIEWVNVTPQLRDSLLFRGQVDAAGAFASTSYFNLLGIGARAEDIVVMPFAEYGFELFGNGLIVSADYAARNGELLRRFVRASMAGMRDALADRAAAVAAVTRRDQTANAQVEAARFQFIIERSILTPHVVQNGVSTLPPDRLARVTQFLAEAFEIPVPSPDSYYTDAFLPPLAERRIPAA